MEILDPACPCAGLATIKLKVYVTVGSDMSDVTVKTNEEEVTPLEDASVQTPVELK